MKDFPLDPTDLLWLSGLARALLGEAQAADDLAQETATAAIESSLPVDAPRRAWLGSVARRLAARRFRTDARRARREQHAARPEALPDSTELIEKAEIAELVTAAARRLPEPYRRTILLRFLEGRSSAEIAREEGKPVDTVRWRVRRGLEMLREDLVQRHDRDWSSWSVLLLPLASTYRDVGLSTTGASGVVTGMVVSMTAMKATLAVMAAVSCVGLWLVWKSGEEGARFPLATDPPTVADAAPSRAALEVQTEVASAEPESSRAAITEPTPKEVAATEPLPRALLGQVVDEAGNPVAAATVYLVPRDTRTSGSVRARTETDWRGAFQFSPDDWEPAGEGEPSLELGVAANGFLRKVVPLAPSTTSQDALVVILERGQTLSGRVVDEFGQPVRNLELLAYTPNASIDHVSPSQRLLRAQRNELAGSSSNYQHGRAKTDGRGEVVFTGLPAANLGVLALDPGWTIEGARREQADDPYVVWTAKRRLGVRLLVIDEITGRPVERAAANFRFELTFGDGEVRDFGKWVGRGAGEVSFVLDPALMPGLEERTITRVLFYGTARSGRGEEVSWTADPIDNQDGAGGVAEVLVEVSPEDPALSMVEGSKDSPVKEPTPARLILDVRYEDSAPFENELEVVWASAQDPKNTDKARATAEGIGRYSLDVVAGDLVLEVADRFSYGSLPPWRGEVRCAPDRDTIAFVTLPRGAAATISRPMGWSGEWFLQAAWRPPGSEDWRGSWGFSTAESSVTLSVLRPAEWRFELRRDSALQRDPIVRTALLKEGETVLVDE